MSSHWISGTVERFERLVSHYFTGPAYPSTKLQEAMSFAIINGGKRIRPLLVYATGVLFNAPIENLDAVALSIECIHSYSLVHDDLPAMDNASLRRGKPTCHKIFGEDVALLAGDGLQSLAFEILISYPSLLANAQKINLVHLLSRACGPWGMAAGQALDMLNIQDRAFTEKDLITLYQLKTGALFKASIQMAIASAMPIEEKERQILDQFADHLSLAFQLQDDLLDMEGHLSFTGKDPQDKNHLKTTYGMLLGSEKAKLMVNELFEKATDILNNFPGETLPLMKVLQLLDKRKH